MENISYSSKEEDYGSDLAAAALVPVFVATDGMDVETVEILVEDMVTTGG